MDYLENENRSAEKQYHVDRPEGAKVGRFNSWEITNEYIARKETDKSFFEYNESGIPQEVRWFFEADNLSLKEKIYLTLVYQKAEHSAYIVREAALGRTRIIWNVDLGNKFKKYLENEDCYPILLFERMNRDKYVVYFEKGETAILEQPLDDTHSEQEKLEQAESMDIDSLRQAAIMHGKAAVQEKQVQTTQRERDPYISEYAKRRANGLCELCRMPAPFNNTKGIPYLESHHVIWLSEGGSDTIDNVVALCPNCHRKIHVLKKKDDVEELLSRIRHYSS